MFLAGQTMIQHASGTKLIYNWRDIFMPFYSVMMSAENTIISTTSKQAKLVGLFDIPMENFPLDTTNYIQIDTNNPCPDLICIQKLMSTISN